MAKVIELPLEKGAIEPSPRHDRAGGQVVTAFVNHGEKIDGPYDEFDEPRPINVYGRSKYEGELLVLRLVPKHFVIRAGWMVGGVERDHKFVAKVIDQLRAGATTIRAVTDKAERAALKQLAEQESSSQATTLGDLLKEKLAQKATEGDGEE